MSIYINNIKRLFNSRFDNDYMLLIIFCYSLIFSQIFLYFNYNFSLYLGIISILVLGSYIIKVIIKERSYIIVFIILFFLIGQFVYQDVLRLGGSHDPGNYGSMATMIDRYDSIKFENNYLKTWPGYIITIDGYATSQFLPLYSIFLSGYYALFGIKGFVIGNIMLLFASIFFIGKVVLLCTASDLGFKRGVKSRKVYTWIVLLLLLNVITIYITRENYVENFLTFFLWSGIYYFLRGVKLNDINQYLLGFTPYLTILLIRHEGFLYIFGALALLIIYYKWNQLGGLLKKNSFISVFSVFILVFFAVFWYYFKIDSSVFINVIHQIGKIFQGSHTIVHDFDQYGGGYERSLTIIFVFYSFLFFGVITAFIYGSKFISKKEFWFILLLLLPQIFFLYKPGIAFYLPWGFRRYYSGLFVLSVVSIIVVLLNYRRYHVPLLLIILTNIVSIPSMYYTITNNVLEITSHVSTFKVPVVFYDKYALENIGNIAFDYFDKQDIILDREPLKDKKYYDFLIGSGDFIIVSSFDYQKISNDFRNKYGFSLDSSMRSLYSEKYQYSYIDTFCDLRKYIINYSLLKNYADVRLNCIDKSMKYSMAEKEVYFYYIANGAKYFQDINLTLTNNDRIGESGLRF